MRQRSALAQAIADARGDAAVLRRNGHPDQAGAMEDLCDKISSAAEDYLRVLTIADAQLKSGLSPRTLRRRFRELVDCGLAELGPHREMLFCACAIPQRAIASDLRERGRAAARSVYV